MNRKITAIVVDDDVRSREVLKYHLAAIPDIDVIGTAPGADEALQMLLESVPDMLFLDVEMPGKTGFDLVAELHQLKISTCIVFQTAFDRYAIQAIKSAAFDYLMKPIDPEELREVVAKYRQTQKQGNFEVKIDCLLSQLNPQKKVKLHTHKGLVLINYEDIFYCQADWNYSIVHYGHDKRETVSVTLGKLLEILPKICFFRISRSIIVNLRHVVKISNTKLQCTILRNGSEITFKITKNILREIENHL